MFKVEGLGFKFNINQTKYIDKNWFLDIRSYIEQNKENRLCKCLDGNSLKPIRKFVSEKKWKDEKIIQGRIAFDFYCEECKKIYSLVAIYESDSSIDSFKIKSFELIKEFSTKEDVKFTKEEWIKCCERDYLFKIDNEAYTIYIESVHSNGNFIKVEYGYIY